MPSKPMTGQAFFVLTALADGPRHGYGIVGEVADLSGGRVKLKIGGLYGVLERLAVEAIKLGLSLDEVAAALERHWERLKPDVSLAGKGGGRK